jgi:phosphoribosylformylglycinamidine synthase PurS subunit
MKVRVFVTLKRKILDPQGRAVHQALQSMGFGQVKDVRLGKLIEMEFAPQSADAVRKSVSEMCDKLLANPVIEDYRVEIDEGVQSS